jgi:hypothetical protein
LHNQFLQIT